MERMISKAYAAYVVPSNMWSICPACMLSCAVLYSSLGICTSHPNILSTIWIRPPGFESWVGANILLGFVWNHCTGLTRAFLPSGYTLGTRAAEHKGCNWGMQIDWWFKAMHLELCSATPSCGIIWHMPQKGKVNSHCMTLSWWPCHKIVSVTWLTFTYTFTFLHSTHRCIDNLGSICTSLPNILSTIITGNNFGKTRFPRTSRI